MGKISMKVFDFPVDGSNPVDSLLKLDQNFTCSSSLNERIKGLCGASTS
jgi:hypothetical protein